MIHQIVRSVLSLPRTTQFINIIPKYTDSIFSLTQKSHVDHKPIECYKEGASLYIIQRQNRYNIQVEERKKHINKRQEDIAQYINERKRYKKEVYPLIGKGNYSSRVCNIADTKSEKRPTLERVTKFAFIA